MRFDNVRLLCDHYRDTFLFYRDVIGLTCTYGDEGSSYAAFSEGPHLFDRAEMMASLDLDALPRGAATNVLVFEVPNLYAETAAIVARGAMPIAPITKRASWGVATVHLLDPEGNLVELMTPLD